MKMFLGILLFSLTLTLMCNSHNNDLDAKTYDQRESDISQLRRNFTNRLRKRLLNIYEYDNTLYPPKRPVEVNVSLEVVDLQEVSEVSMTFHIEIYLGQYWTDDRLVFEEEDYAVLGSTYLNKNLYDLIWRPDSYFSNALRSNGPSKDDDSFSHKMAMKIKSDGTVQYSQRLSLTARCPMSLTRFPFDFQVCKLVFESYSIVSKDLLYKWKRIPKMTEQLIPTILPEFFISNITYGVYELEQSGKNYSQLYTCFLLVRKGGFYFMELYAPAIMIVIVAWVSSNPKYDYFGEMLEILLAVLFLYCSYFAVMPRVSELKAIDTYFLVCLAFVFISLMQALFLRDPPNLKDAKMGFTAKEYQRYTVKYTCYWLHPILFSLFNGCYFIVYKSLDFHDDMLKCP